MLTHPIRLYSATIRGLYYTIKAPLVELFDAWIICGWLGPKTIFTTSH